MKNGVREIAKLAKVSIGTVSNVLNRPEVVTPETVERVNAAIQELGYQVGARKRGRRRLVLCDTPESEALIDKAIAQGLAIEKICICEEGKREKALRYLLENKAAAGAILLVGQAGGLAQDLSNFLGS
ncbi:MAG: LacI family DNA-binding transcriptional regulator [Candidatus Nanopelagicaceae bacterium]